MKLFERLFGRRHPQEERETEELHELRNKLSKAQRRRARLEAELLRVEREIRRAPR